jgi:hypothetical protein
MDGLGSHLHYPGRLPPSSPRISCRGARHPFNNFITPAALSAQTPALAQWALHSIPVEILQTAAYGDLYSEEDITVWYDPATYFPQSNPHNTNTFVASILDTASTSSSILQLFSPLIYNNSHLLAQSIKSTTPNRPGTAQIALEDTSHNNN